MNIKYFWQILTICIVVNLVIINFVIVGINKEIKSGIKRANNVSNLPSLSTGIINPGGGSGASQDVYMSLKGSKTACLASLNSSDNGRLVEMYSNLFDSAKPGVNDFFSKFSDGEVNVFFSKTTEPLINYMACGAIFDAGGEITPKIAEEYMNKLIGAFSSSVAGKRAPNSFSKKNEQLQKALSLYSPFFLLSVLDDSQICPNGKENPRRVQLLKDKFSPEDDSIKLKLFNFFDGHCKKIKEYANNDVLKEKEIYNFSDWAVDPTEREFQYSWYSVLVYRFKGKEAADKICSSLALKSEKDKCLKNILGWEELKKIIDEFNCGGWEKNLLGAKEIICEYLNKK